MQALHAANTEPIPGYRLLEPIGRGGFGEVWKCQAPGGLIKAVKFVPGHRDEVTPGGGGAERELRALQHVLSIRHPYLLAMDRVEMIDGDLVIVMELADKSLHDLLQENRAAGRPGVPRGQLLAYLREAAEALDLMNQQHGLQHLDVKPRNLFLLGQHVKVADFGLVNNLNDLVDGRADTRDREAITPLYAAPETFFGKVSRFCDQYSLAISYCELLTGTLPFVGKNFRQMALAHVQGQPDLSALPEQDHSIIRKALAKVPSERHASCLDMVRALEGLGPVAVPAQVPRSRGTKHEVCLGELSNTAVGSASSQMTVAAGSRLDVPRVGSRASSAQSGTSLVPGYQLLECVGRSPIGEVWKAFDEDGEPWIVKLVLAPPASEDADNDPVAILQSLRHEVLAPLQVLPISGERLALVTNPGDGSLYDRMKEAHQHGLPGVPRMELISYLKPVAEALDALQRSHRMQHLGLTPRHIVLDDGQVRLLDYGLVELFYAPAGHEASAVNTRYSAPELFGRQSSRACDQYSLALIYQELLTGVHAFRNLNQRQMATVRLRGKPDVGLLPGIDRPVVLKALHLDPDQRFGSCAEFIAALEGVSYDVNRPPAAATRALKVTVPVPAVRPTPAGPVAPAPLHSFANPSRKAAADAARAAIAAEVAAAAGPREVRSTAALRYVIDPCTATGSSRGQPVLEARCFGRVVPATVRLKLTGLLDQWSAQLRKAHVAGPDAFGAEGPAASRFVFFVRTATSLWQRCLGKQPGLEVSLDITAPALTTEELTEVRVRMVPEGLGAERGVSVLGEMGPALLESLRNYLQLHTERRGEERLPYPRSVQVFPVLPTGEVGEPFVAQGKDISTRGLGLYLPCRLPTGQVWVQIAPVGRPPVAVPARIVRAHPCPDGRTEVGLCFAPEDI